MKKTSILSIIGLLFFISFFLSASWNTKNDILFFIFFQAYIIIFSMILSLEVSDLFITKSPNMTIEEFDNMKLSIQKVKYEDRIYKVAMVNFPERLIGLAEEEGVYWVRCENCELISE